MRSKIVLLYFKGCPNVIQAKTNLRSALREDRRRLRWAEVDLKSPDCPRKWRGFPSPSLLVSGRDIVTGADAQPGTPACRVSAAPRKELILSRLREGWQSYFPKKRE